MPSETSAGGGQLARISFRLRSTDQAITEVALGIDGIMTKTAAQAAAQLADVALDDVLVDFLVEEPVDG